MMFKDRFHIPEYEYDERVFVDYVNRQYTDGLASIKKRWMLSYRQDSPEKLKF